MGKSGPRLFAQVWGLRLCTDLSLDAELECNLAAYTLLVRVAGMHGMLTGFVLVRVWQLDKATSFVFWQLHAVWWMAGLKNR